MKPKRILELDGLRGIAILMVLVWHLFVLFGHVDPATTLSYIQAAGRLCWTGVDLFFVLSGFLIGGILLDERESPNYFKTFYLRRLFRIAPLYLVWFVVTCLLMWTLPGEAGQALHAGKFSMWPYLLYVQNFSMSLSTTQTNPAVGVTWSLAVEEQFYLTLPLVIRYAPRKWLPWILGVGIALAPVIRLLIFHFSANRSGAFMLMPARADALLLGVVGAMIVRSNKYWHKLLNDKLGHVMTIAVLASGAAYLILTRANYNGLMMTGPGYTWMAALYLAVILFAVAHGESVVGTVLRWPALRWMGTIAYGTYLFHCVSLILVYAVLWQVPPDRHATMVDWMADLASIALTISLCSLSWIYFEKPLVALGHRWGYAERLTVKPTPIPVLQLSSNRQNPT